MLKGLVNAACTWAPAIADVLEALTLVPSPPCAARRRRSREQGSLRPQPRNSVIISLGRRVLFRWADPHTA